MASRFAVPVTQLVNDDASGIGSGWKLNFYTTGTSTRKDTFSDNALSSANANPVVADSSGRFGDIFLESGTYKVVLTDGNDVVKWTADPVAGSVGSTGEVDAKTASYTIVAGDASKLINMDATSGALTTSLLTAASATNGFEVSIKKTDSSANAVTIDGNGSETIDGATTLVLSHQNDEATLRCDGSNWFVVAADHGGLGRSTYWKKGADIASAGTLVVGTDGNYFDITGTTGITAVTVPAGMLFMWQFDGALTLTHHATNLDLPGEANITTAAGDVLVGFATGANTVQVVSYTRADGKPVVPSGGLVQIVNTQSGAVATGTTVMVDDDTIPQNDEGDEYLTLAITPKNTANILIIDVVLAVASTVAGQMILGLFQDSTAGALAAASLRHGDSVNVVRAISLRHKMIAGTTSSTTFKARAGVASANTTTFNGESGARVMGGVIASSITIREYLP